MAFDPSPVRGLPSYLEMAKPSARHASPRFWLEPKYEALLRDADGLAFELCGSGVKAMTEEDYVAASGNMQHSGKASLAAQNWANLMTDKYPELAVADPIFGQLQNCMDLAVVGALVVKDRLLDKAGNSLPTLMESPDVEARPLPRAKAGRQHGKRAEEARRLGHQRLRRRGDQLLADRRQGQAQRHDGPRPPKSAPAKWPMVVELTQLSDRFGKPSLRPGA